jgi:hypothetical protein
MTALPTSITANKVNWMAAHSQRGSNSSKRILDCCPLSSLRAMPHHPSGNQSNLIANDRMAALHPRQTQRNYLTAPVFKRPLPVLIDMKKSANTTEMIAISFITMLSAGPDVSLRGSPTVSPTTAPACAADFLPA